MKAISRAIDRFCERHRRFGIPRLMFYIVVCAAVAYVISMMDMTYTFLGLLSFDVPGILSGEVWRLVTWIFLPYSSGIFFVALTLYFYHFIGSTLEREWGAPKFTLYYILGMLLNVLYGFIAWFIFKSPSFLDPFYLNLSMFFAFAVLFPDHVLLLFFIIPVKIKWLALVDGAVFLLSALRSLFVGNYFAALLPVVAFLNFFIFCAYDLGIALRPFNPKNHKSTIDFKKAAKKAKQDINNSPYKSKCSVCGKTDLDNPGLEFRYCSRCEGYHCFCVDHINNHVHFK